MSSIPAFGVSTGPRHAARVWRNAFASVALLISVFFLYGPSSESLMELWSDTGRTTYTHGYVIAALVVWLVWRRRDALAAIPWSPSIAGALLVAAAGVMWLVFVRASIELFHQLLLLGVLWLAVWAVFGLRMARQLWLPIAFLIFAIPIWDQINFLLQETTVQAVALLLDVTTIPVWVDGNFVHLAAGTFEVAGGCSGIHFFIVSLALATLYGEIGQDSWKVRVQLLALASGLALLANWLRVYIIIVAGYLTDMQHFLIREGHYNFGWMVFAVTMLVFFLLARRLAPATRQSSSTVATQEPGMSRVAVLLIAVACVLALPILERLRKVEPALLTTASLPPPPAGWSRSEAGAASTWNPIFGGADRIERAVYASPEGREVQLYIASYAAQGQNKELVAYGNALMSPGEGSVVAESRVVSGGTARDLLIQGPGKNSVNHYYYDIGGHRTDRGVFAQLWYGVLTLRREVVSSVFALRAECAGDCDEARTRLAEFAKTVDARNP